MKIQGVMTRNVKTCRPETNLAEAASTMLTKDCGVLPVVNEENKVIGMITDRDIAIAAATRGWLASDISVGDVVSGEVHSISLDEDIKSALEIMQRAKVRRLPVIDDDGLLQGILSLNDIVLLAQEKGEQSLGFSYKDVVITFKALCEHRPQQAAARA